MAAPILAERLRGRFMRLLEGIPDLEFPVSEDELPIEEFLQAVADEVQDRWKSLNTSPEMVRPHEVVGAMLARGGSLACQLALNPSFRTVTVGRMMVRAIVENRINMSWVLVDLEPRTEMFRDYGLGQAKLSLEVLRAEGVGTEIQGYMETLAKDERDWLNSQKYEQFVDVNVGNWSGKTVRAMAQEVGLSDLYRTVYQPMSSSPHSTWHIVGQDNLEICPDPLHGAHHNPLVVTIEPSAVHFLWMAALTFDGMLQDFDRWIGTPGPRRSVELLDDCFPRARTDTSASD